MARSSKGSIAHKATIFVDYHQQDHLRHAIEQLDDILRDPGRTHLPEALVDTLRALQGMLMEMNKASPADSDDDLLAAELSQDADHS
jgi:hypothetical protein